MGNLDADSPSTSATVEGVCKEHIFGMINAGRFVQAVTKRGTRHPRKQNVNEKQE